jgi:hypothetical protein
MNLKAQWQVYDFWNYPMIVPIWRKVFLFRFKRERTTPESLMGTDSGFVLVLAIFMVFLVSL